ncbi:MAG: GlsB/YeaQ/YmgE family stress response membrane protein, partial [Candidatus Accumulibacter sp.]|nr:GlsB/YeaQ/YmgE family stress response membrane protein [Accumulibacter sp.]
MGILYTILVGLVIGVVARFIHPGKENMGIVMTVLLGIGGSFVAGIVG